MVLGILPLNAMGKIMRKAGAKRPSQSAMEELKFLLEKKLKRIALISNLSVKNSRRKTVLKKDIMFAIKQIGEEDGL
jgi:histone H3/H4